MKIFSYYNPPYTGKHYTKFYCWLMTIIKYQYGNCYCHYQIPYGLIISADCDKHD